MTLEINFDFELYTNFTTYSKFLGKFLPIRGDQKCFIFLAPIDSKNLKIMLVMETKPELA